MSEQDLIYDDIIHCKVVTIWEKIFGASNKIIVNARIYGFSGIGVIPDPNIHDIVKSVRVVRSMLQEINSFDDLHFEDNRLILNSIAQLTTMELLALSVQNNDRNSFEELLASLDGQAAH